MAAARDAIAGWPDKKPWIDDKERKAASKQVGAWFEPRTQCAQEWSG